MHNPFLSGPAPNSGLHLPKMAQIGPPPPPGLASLYTYTQPRPSAGFRNLSVKEKEEGKNIQEEQQQKAQQEERNKDENNDSKK